MFHDRNEDGIFTICSMFLGYFYYYIQGTDRLRKVLHLILPRRNSHRRIALLTAAVTKPRLNPMKTLYIAHSRKWKFPVRGRVGVRFTPPPITMISQCNCSVVIFLIC